MAQDVFNMTPDQRAKYSQQFQLLGPVGGFVTGDQAKGLFLKSGLAPKVLGIIWALADVDADGRMDVNEFSIAIHLIALKLKGVDPPTVLPLSLASLVAGRGPAASPIVSPTSSQTGRVAGAPAVTTADWDVPPASRIKYGQLFNATEGAKTGYISGNVARGILLKFGLPNQVLAQIWNLADTDATGRLSPEEFILAMHLIDMAKTGKGIPLALPPSLYPPSLRTKKSASRTSMSSIGGGGPPSRPAPPQDVPPAKPPPPIIPPAPAADKILSQSKRAGSITSTDTAWAVPFASRTKYSQHFSSVDTGKTGFLTGDQARGILLQTGVPNSILAQVWNLSDIGAKGRLTREEYIIAMHLVDMVKTGQKIPLQLTADLLPPSHRPPGTAAAAASTTTGAPPPVPEAPRVQLRRESDSAVEWAIPQTSKLKYTQQFNSVDKHKTGFLTGNQARGILLQSGLPHTTLAQIWNLSDIEAVGRLTCDEFILAMHLVDMVKAGDAIPVTLPLHLIPPSHRRKRTTSSTSGASSGTTAAGGDENASGSTSPTKASFEDKRKENFDKGQAELDRRRQILMEEQKREAAERARKEREEAEKREKIRLEQERKKQEELQRQAERQRELEEERERERRKKQEQQDAARREMERQRVEEWEKQRKIEMESQREKTSEALQHIRSKRKRVAIEKEQVLAKLGELKKDAEASRSRVAGIKTEIDDMRKQRDTKMASMGTLKSNLKSLQDRQLILTQERTRMSTQLKQLNIQSPTTIEGMELSELVVKTKEAAINQLKSKLEDLNKEKEIKSADMKESDEALEKLKDQIKEITERTRELQERLAAKQKEAVAKKESLTQVVTDPTAAWDTVAPAATAVASDNWSSQAEVADVAGGSAAPTRYRAVYAFEARNHDELTIEPGNEVTVDHSTVTEEGWYMATLNGNTGLIPDSYVEPLDAANAAVSATTVAAPSDAAATEGQVAIAVYPYAAKEDNQLTVQKGDRIKVISREDLWIYGEAAADGSKGWLPDSYVRWVPTGTDSSATESPLHGQEFYISIYPFESTEPGDLTFTTGELIAVNHKDGEWWTGSIGPERFGVFPYNYAREASSEEITEEKTVDESTGATAASTAAASVADATGTAAVASAATTASASPATSKKSISPSQSAQGHRRTDSEVSRDSPRPKKTKAKKAEIVTVIASYQATGPEQLTIEKGQLVAVKKKTDTGWWEGEVSVKGKGKMTGWFPASYVKTLKE